MRNSYPFILGIFWFILGVGCRDPYMPVMPESDTDILVVEGFLNVGQDETRLRITRSTDVSRDNNIVIEQGAYVTVEGEDNSVQLLPSTGNGYYTAALQLSFGSKYRVRINTLQGVEYLSEYVEAKQTPEIDSIGWDRTGRGVMMHVNTHDDTNNSIYYRWEYDETWEINTYFISGYVFENLMVRERRLDEYRNVCWKYDGSQNIKIGNSSRLQSDQISRAPLVLISPGHEKLSVRYSILVRQYVLDKEGYEFFDLMKKNTESLGTIFDPQPSELRGNFTCITNPEEPVLGYLTASSVTEKRHFVRNSDFPGWNYSENCPTKEVTPDSIVYYFGSGDWIPYTVEEVIPGNITMYYGAYPRCVDCTWRGGYLNRPPYW